MPYNHKDKQIVQGHGNHDAQEHCLPTVIQLLAGQKVCRRYDTRRYLHGAFTANPDIGRGRLRFGGYQEYKITVMDWP